MRLVEEEPVLDDPGDGIELLCQFAQVPFRLTDAAVEDGVAVVGAGRLPVRHLADLRIEPQVGKQRPRAGQTKADHLNRHGRFRTELLDPLALVTYENEGGSTAGDDLLPGQGTAQTLDGPQRRIDLVHAVDRHVDAAWRQLDERDAQLPGLLLGGDRGGHTADAGEFAIRNSPRRQFNETPGRAARTQAHHHSTLYGGAGGEGAFPLLTVSRTGTTDQSPAPTR